MWLGKKYYKVFSCVCVHASMKVLWMNTPLQIDRIHRLECFLPGLCIGLWRCAVILGEYLNWPAAADTAPYSKIECPVWSWRARARASLTRPQLLSCYGCTYGANEQWCDGKQQHSSSTVNIHDPPQQCFIFKAVLSRSIRATLSRSVNHSV